MGEKPREEENLASENIDQKAISEVVERMVINVDEGDKEREVIRERMINMLTKAIEKSPELYHEIIKADKSPSLIRLLAENIDNGDEGIYVTATKLRTDKSLEPERFESGKQKSDFRIWERKPTTEKRGFNVGHFDANDNMIARVGAEAEDVEREVKRLLKEMVLVEEEDYSPKSGKDMAYVTDSKLYKLKKREEGVQDYQI